MVVYFRRTQRDHKPLDIQGSPVEILKNTKFLGEHLAENTIWSLNTGSSMKKAQQHLHFLRRVRRAHLPPPILISFYSGTIESFLGSCITAGPGNCSQLDSKNLQQVVRTIEKIIRVTLPSFSDIFTKRCIRKATIIVEVSTKPSHKLFFPLPSGRRYCSIRSVTTRLQNSFFPQAIRLLDARGLT